MFIHGDQGGLTVGALEGNLAVLQILLIKAGIHLERLAIIIGIHQYHGQAVQPRERLFIGVGDGGLEGGDLEIVVLESF